MNIFFVTRESSYIHMARDSSDISSSIQWSEKNNFLVSVVKPLSKVGNLHLWGILLHYYYLL